MEQDIPSFTDHEIRALIYIHTVEQETGENEKPSTIAELEDLTGWQSKYYTRAWKRLQPRGLVKRVQDGRNTRLSLTEEGHEVAHKFMEISEVMNQ